MAENTVPATKVETSVSQDPLLQKTADALRRMRYFRRQYDQRRAYFYRQYLGQRDQKTFPDNVTPRSNTFVPYPLSNVETVVSRVLDAFFSFEPWFECKGRGANDDGAAEAMGHVLKQMLSRGKFIEHFEALVRNIAIYGHSGLKVDWDWDYDDVVYAEPQYAMDPQTGQPLMQPVIDPQSGQPVGMQPVILGYHPAVKKVPRNRPKFIPIDVYDLLIDPDGGIVAHLTERTLGQLLREQEASVMAAQQDPTGTKQPLYEPQALAQLKQKVYAAEQKDPEAVVVRLAEVWDEYDRTQTILTFGEDSEAISWKDLRASYRATGYSPYKRKVFAGQPILLYHGPNPFSHGKAPILHTSFIKLPNEIYGLGAIEIISDLTEAMNRFVNMIADNWNLGINRRYAFDTAADIDHDALNSFNVPGGKVGVSGDPTKVIMPLPFFTPQAGDYQVLDVYKGMIEMGSGISDFYGKAVGSPTNNKTATGINQVINESNFRFKMFIRNLELDVLQPLLSMCASMVQQYLTDQVEVQITGEPQPGIPKFVTLSPEDLIGTVEFEMVAANYATNKMVRQRTLLEFVNLVGSSPYWNQYEGLKEMAKVFEIRNISKLLYTPQQVTMMQQQQQSQQMEMMIFESMLNTESKARLSQAKPQASGGGQGKGGGPKTYKVGPIKGAGLEGAIRNFAQAHGANALGLEGLGKINTE